MDDQPRGKTTPKSNSGSFAPKDTPAEVKRLDERNKGIDLGELKKEERRNNQLLTKKPKRGRLSKRQKAIAWADANRDAANSNPKGFATTNDIYIGYDADESYAERLTWNAKIPNGNKGIKKRRKK